MEMHDGELFSHRASPRGSAAQGVILFCETCAVRMFRKTIYIRRTPEARASNDADKQAHSTL